MKNVTKPTVHGVGINDANYKVYKYVNGKAVWRCPFYGVWVDMLRRCYSVAWLKKHPSYKGVTVCKEWRSFMNFRAWMIMQDWEGNDLDKDLKVIGNKIYSPETCMFIPANVNTFIIDRGGFRGDYPIGVTHDENYNRFVSRISDLTSKRIYLGYFSTPEEAHEAWRKKKIELAVKLMQMQDRHEVKQGIDNYMTYVLQTNYYLNEWKNTL